MTYPEPDQPYQYPAYSQQYAPPVAYPPAYAPYPPPPRKPRHWPWIVGAVVVLLAAVAALAPAAHETASKSLAPVKSQIELIHEWQAEVKPDVTNLENAMAGVANATDPVDIPGLHSACSRVEQYSGRILNHLPTMHAQLGDEVYQAMSQYVNSGQACQNLTLSSPDADVAVVAGFIKDGNEHLARATAIIKSLS